MAIGLEPTRSDASDVAAAYGFRVLLPAGLMVGLTLISAIVWYSGTYYVKVGQTQELHTELRWFVATAGVALVGWVAIVLGTMAAGRRFRADREQHNGNGARAWRTTAWVVVALTAVYGVALPVAMYLWLGVMVGLVVVGGAL